MFEGFFFNEKYEEKNIMYIMIKLCSSLSLKNSLDLLLPYDIRDAYRDSQGLVSEL